MFPNPCFYAEVQNFNDPTDIHFLLTFTGWMKHILTGLESKRYPGDEQFSAIPPPGSIHADSVDCEL